MADSRLIRLCPECKRPIGADTERCEHCGASFYISHEIRAVRETARETVLREPPGREPDEQTPEESAPVSEGQEHSQAAASGGEGLPVVRELPDAEAGESEQPRSGEEPAASAEPLDKGAAKPDDKIAPGRREAQPSPASGSLPAHTDRGEQSRLAREEIKRQAPAAPTGRFAAEQAAPPDVEMPDDTSALAWSRVQEEPESDFPYEPIIMILPAVACILKLLSAFARELIAKNAAGFLSFALIIWTAKIAYDESKKVFEFDCNPRKELSPVVVLAGIILGFPVFYPYYLNIRSEYGAKDYTPYGLFISIVYTLSIYGARAPYFFI